MFIIKTSKQSTELVIITAIYLKISLIKKILVNHNLLLKILRIKFLNKTLYNFVHCLKPFGFFRVYMAAKFWL